MKIILFVISLILAGCQSEKTGSDPDGSAIAIRTHLFWYPSRRRMEQFAFTESVQTPLAKELSGESATYYGKETWAEYWIWRCELLNYEGCQNCIDYIIEQRRQKGLPDIPELRTRSFSTPWQIFLQSAHRDIECEAKSVPPPGGAKTWQDYWRDQFAGFRANKNIGEKGVHYVKDARGNLNLAPIREKPF